MSTNGVLPEGCSRQLSKPGQHSEVVLMTLLYGRGSCHMKSNLNTYERRAAYSTDIQTYRASGYVGAFESPKAVTMSVNRLCSQQIKMFPRPV